jgi:hypothetical protein
MAEIERLRKNETIDIVGTEDGVSRLDGNRYPQVCGQRETYGLVPEWN